MNALAAASRRNPYALYALMRRVCPVLHVRRHNLWLLFDFESVHRALNDPNTFSSRAAPPGGSPLDWLIFLDPPRHTKLRALIVRTFTSRSIGALEPRIRLLTTELLDSIIDRGTMDMVADLAAPLPLLVIAEMLGIPREDRSRFQSWSNAILHLSDTIAGGEQAARALECYRAAKEEMKLYVGELLAKRRIAPQNDLLTRLVEAEASGEKLDENEILDFFQLLLLAGSETTTNLIANALLCFFDHPDDLQRVRNNPDLLPAAIEEVLRYRSPVAIVFRTTLRDVTMHRRTIPAGQLVLPVIASANRDGRRFADPGRFDISRAPNGHAAFGHGIHFCIGAALARLEARVVLSELLQRLKGLRPASKRWQPRRALNVHGPQSLPICFERGRRIGQSPGGARRAQEHD